MRKPLWTPSEERRKQANITSFISHVNMTRDLSLSSYRKLYDWSITKIPDFWAAMWEFGGIRSSGSYDAVVDDLKKYPGANWFVGAQLNFAENLLRFKDDHLAFHIQA